LLFPIYCLKTKEDYTHIEKLICPDNETSTIGSDLIPLKMEFKFKFNPSGGSAKNKNEFVYMHV